MTTATFEQSRPRTLPPRGLALTLLAQLPLVAAAWPVRPSGLELILGAALVGAGCALNVWADRLFKAGGIGVCPFSPAPALLGRGPFRFTRNPMYLGLVAIVLGTSLMTGVLANAWSAVAFFIWLHWAYVLPEEQWLRERFGPVFDEYASRVPRWLIR